MKTISNSRDNLTTNGAEIKLAGNDNKEKMYEPKHKKKLVRVFTVIAYVFSVSLAAIMLSLFYMFIYNPSKPSTESAKVRTLSDFNQGIQRKNLEIIYGEMGRAYNDSHLILEREEPRALPVKIIKTAILKSSPKREDAISRIVKKSLENNKMHNNVSFKKIINFLRF